MGDAPELGINLAILMMNYKALSFLWFYAEEYRQYIMEQYWFC